MKKRMERVINAAPMVPLQMKNLHPYNILADGDDAEINMYGEVVESIPIDWWTGEPVSGLFIVLEEFLKDIEGLKNKRSVTVRINSIGGDLWAGLSIYNRLKEMDNVTTIVDGLAASAASIIAQAGKTGCRKIYESGQIMIHGASVGLCDYYNIQQLDGVREQLKAANESVVAVYAERTGESRTKLTHMVEQTTWMTGKDAVEKGFADEVIQGEVTMSISADRSLFCCNGIPMNARNLVAMPHNVRMVSNIELQPGKPDVDKSKVKGGEKSMTLEELKAQHPELVSQIEAAASTSVDSSSDARAAVEAERQRIKDIESIEASIADKELVKEAKYGTNPMDAKDLAFQAMQKQAKLGNIFLSGLHDDLNHSGAVDINAVPNSGIDVTNKEQVFKDEEDIRIAVEAAKKIRGGK